LGSILLDPILSAPFSLVFPLPLSFSIPFLFPFSSGTNALIACLKEGLHFDLSPNGRF